MVNRKPFASANDSTAYDQVGHEFSRNGKMYRYIQVEDADLAANDVVAFSDATSFEVTKDRAGGSAISVDFAGIGLGAVTDGNYGYVQIAGPATCKVAAGVAVAAGDKLVLHASSDGSVAVATTTTLPKAFATALAADTATTSAAGTVAAMIDLA